MLESLKERKKKFKTMVRFLMLCPQTGAPQMGEEKRSGREATKRSWEVGFTPKNIYIIFKMVDYLDYN